MKKTVSIIVGANSFLAGYLAQLLHHKHQQIIGIYNSNTDKIDKAFYHKIISNAELNELHDENITTIYFLNSFIPYGKMNEGNAKFYRQNVAPVEQISQLFPDAKMVLASSVSVYPVQDELITEKTTPAPQSLYGKSKIQAEQIIEKQKKYSIVRFSSIYGEGMTQKTMLPMLIKNAKRTGVISLYGDGSREQNYIHVSDAAKFLFLASKSEVNDIYLGTGSEEYSNLQIAAIIKNNLPEVKIEFQGEDTASSFRYDNSATLHKLKYTFGYNIEKGLEELIKSNGQ